MPRPEIPTNADNVYGALKDIGRMYVFEQARRIEDRFPTLKDGSKGLKIGRSPSAMWHQVLRPDGSMEWVDYHKEIPVRSVDGDFYLNRATLNRVEHNVDSVDFGWRDFYDQSKNIVEANSSVVKREKFFPQRMIGKPQLYLSESYARETAPMGLPIEDEVDPIEVFLTLADFSDTVVNRASGVVHIVRLGEMPENSRVLYEMENNSVRNGSGNLIKDREDLGRLAKQLRILESTYAQARQLSA